MPIRIVDNGKNNIVDVDAAGMESHTGTIVMEGDDNVVSIATSVVSSGFNFQVRGGSRIHIGPRCHLGQLFVWADAGSTLSIGDSVGFNGIVRLQMHEPGKITIGNGCLFASEVEMTISDMHSIIDVGSGRRINPAQDITLGERVWVGQRAMILKGVAIGFGAVVGAAAIVTRPVPPNCVVAGNPARIVRYETSWNFHLLPIEPPGKPV